MARKLWDLLSVILLCTALALMFGTESTPAVISRDRPAFNPRKPLVLWQFLIRERNQHTLNTLENGCMRSDK